MADEDKFYYQIIHSETGAVIQGREYMTKDEANRRNHELRKKGVMKHEWARCDAQKVYYYDNPTQMYDQ